MGGKDNILELLDAASFHRIEKRASILPTCAIDGSENSSAVHVGRKDDILELLDAASFHGIGKRASILQQVL